MEANTEWDGWTNELYLKSLQKIAEGPSAAHDGERILQKQKHK